MIIRSVHVEHADIRLACHRRRGPERFSSPKILTHLVDAGKLGTKTGAGSLDVPAERTPELIAYRIRAYVLMQKLIGDLGPAPLR